MNITCICFLTHLSYGVIENYEIVESMEFEFFQRISFLLYRCQKWPSPNWFLSDSDGERWDWNAVLSHCCNLLSLFRFIWSIQDWNSLKFVSYWRDLSFVASQIPIPEGIPSHDLTMTLQELPKHKSTCLAL